MEDYFLGITREERKSLDDLEYVTGCMRNTRVRIQVIYPKPYFHNPRYEVRLVLDNSLVDEMVIAKTLYAHKTLAGALEEMDMIITGIHSSFMEQGMSLMDNLDVSNES